MNLFQPKKINYDFKELQNQENLINQNQEASKSKSRSKSPEDRRKPVIDYKVKINQLEKQIHTIKQNFDDSRTKNGYLRNELDELRKNVIINKEKVKALYNEFVKTETSYWDQKKMVVKNITAKQDLDELQSKVVERKKLLEQQNKEMIKKIKDTDREMTLKLAEKKFYEHEKSKLIEKENKIIQKWNKEREKFLNKNKEDINNMSAFSAKSKVLEILLSDRIDYFEQMILKLSAETNIDDICKLVEFFINSMKEVNKIEK
jgi:hypothetical protein